MRLKIIKIITLAYLIFLLAGWSSQPNIIAKKGEVALDNWDFNKNGIVSLEGEWKFYWEAFEPKQLINQQPTYMNVPSVWNFQKQFPPSGYALYEIQINGLQIGKSYGLKIPNMSNSYHLWLDDNLIITNGTPGKTKHTTIPFYKQQEVFFEANSRTIKIFMTISNFHYRSGGMWSSIQLGTPGQISSLSKKNLAFEMILFGSLVLSGLYHIVLYIFRKKETILLLFGMSCLVISARIAVIGEQIIMEFFPTIPWEIIVKTEFLTFYIVVPLFSWYLHGLYKHEIAKLFCKWLTTISLLFSLLVVFTPAIIYTKSLFLYQGVTIITVLYILGALIMATVRKREGAKVVLVCAAIYAITVINDILYINGVIDSDNLSSLGLFIFIFSQSYIIAKSSANAFLKVELYSKQLTELNQTLEEKIYERTKSLEASKLELQRANDALLEISYQDPLTKLPNRRYFDDVYEMEWGNAVKHRTSLSILYFDIDHFKEYNDAYGHQQGDTTLKQVAECLQRTLLKHNGTVARIGGEEFIGIVSNSTSTQINNIGEECRNEVKKLHIPHQDSNTSPYITVSIGLASKIPTKSFSKRKLINMADEALYYAKEEGRDRIVVFNEKSFVSQ